MSSAFAIAESEAPTRKPKSSKELVRPLSIQALTAGNQDEVLGFLAQRPSHTVFMSGLIRDNGLVSVANRGIFYGCRDEELQLTGVALIGTKIVIETNSQSALEIFANLTPNNLTAHLIRGEREQIEYVLTRYLAAGRLPRRFSNEFLLEQSVPASGVGPEPNLRVATFEDLDSVILINAALSFEESGIDPLLKDRPGMWTRTARRVEQGRVWILMDKGRVLFKADIISETPETAFLEGVYVQPQVRRKGYGLRCITQLARHLLARTSSICLVVNEQNQRARSFYEKAGFTVSSDYLTAYFPAA